MGRALHYLGIFVLALACTVARAAPCISQSLDDYIALGAGGCTIGAVTFSDFSLATVFPPATALNSASVALSPSSSALGTGFSVSLGATAPVSASAGEFFSLRFGFNVTAAGLAGAYANLVNPIPLDDAAITLIEDFCTDAPFSDPSNLVCATAPLNLLAVAIDSFADNPVSAAFGPFGLLGVVADIGVDAGLTGSASLAGAELLFVAGATPTPVPAPSTIALLLTALLPLAFLTRRRSAEVRSSA
jgi:hypothetical protein